MAKKLIKVSKDWEKEWQDMPEFSRFNNEPFQKILVNFRCFDDVQKFGELIDRKLTRKTNSIWFTISDHKTPVGVFIDEKED